MENRSRENTYILPPYLFPLTTQIFAYLKHIYSILCSVEKEGESKLISIFCIVQKVKNIRVFIWKERKNRIRPQLFVALLRFILQVEKMKSLSFLLGKYF